MSRSRTAVDRAQLIAGLATLLVIVAIAVATAWPIYASTQAVVAAAVATAIGAGSVLLGWALGWRWWQTGAVAALAYVLAVVPVAIPSAMASPQQMLAGVATGVIDIVAGWKRLLTIEVPAGDYQSVLVPFFFTIALCSLLATALIVHGRRWAPFAVVPMLAMPLFGAFFGTSTTGADWSIGPVSVPAPAHVLLAVLAVAVCATWLLLRARISRAVALRAARSRTGTARLGTAAGGFALRRHLVAAAMVLVTAGVALAAAPLASAFGTREVARDAVDPLLFLQRQASPLSSYREWFRASRYDAPLFSIATTQDVDRLRIATLDSYDGVTFHVSSEEDAVDFTRQPQTQDSQVEVTIEPGFEGVWVPLATADAGAPAFEGPRAAQLADSYYASAPLGAGVVVQGQDRQSVEGLRPGDVYGIETAREVDPSAFEAATGGEALISEDTNPALAAWVESQDLDRTGASLIELVERLRARGYISHASHESVDTGAWVLALNARAPYAFHGSRAGHSTARIEELFASLIDQQERAGESASPELLVAAVGDDEQFATAAALVARHLGFESRVVVGVRVGDAGADSAVPPCDSTCTGANVTAWAEARALGGEWVTLDATPQFSIQPSLIEEGQNPPQNPTEPDQVEADVIDPPTILSETIGESTPEVAPEEEQWLQANLPLILAIATIAVGGLLVLLPFLVFPLAKWTHRRWRRRSAVPEVAMVAAWEELMDRYVDAGIEVPEGLTRAETADVLERQGAVALAAIVDRAVFAEHPPTREASDALWGMLDEERRAVASEISFMQRVRAVFTPASFRRTLRAQRADELSTLRRKDSHVAH